MSIKLEAGDLGLLLRCASRVLPRRQANPILDYVLLEADSRSITEWATNLETYITLSLFGEFSQEKVSLLVDAVPLIHVVKNNEHCEITLDKTDKGYAVSTENGAKFDFTSADRADYPDLTVPETDVSCEVGVRNLCDAVRRVFHAASGVPTPSCSHLVWFKFDGQALTVGATDSRRLAYSVCDAKGPQQAFSACIRREAARTIVDCLDDLVKFADVDTVSVGLADDKLVFTAANEVITLDAFSLTSNERMPDLVKFTSDVLMKVEQTAQFTVNAAHLVSAVRTAIAVARSARNSINPDVLPIILDATESGVTVSCNMLGANSRVPVETTHRSGRCRLAVNPQYLLDLFGACDKDTIDVKLFGSNSPFVCSTKDGSHVGAIMPLALEKVDEQLKV